MTTLRWGSATDTGQVRSNNEDSLLVTDGVFAVADGMGGHAAGEVASHEAIEALRQHAAPTREALVQAVKLANQAVWSKADEDARLRGMGTTVTALVLEPGTDEGDTVVIANVGDS